MLAKSLLPFLCFLSVVVLMLVGTIVTSKGQRDVNSTLEEKDCDQSIDPPTAPPPPPPPTLPPAQAALCSTMPAMSAENFTSLKKSSPESFFYLEKFGRIGYDRQYQGARYRGEIRPIVQAKCFCPEVPEISREACSPHSFFEISLSGPVLLANQTVYNNITESYTFELVIPKAGNYSLSVKLIFMDYPDIYQLVSRQSFIGKFQKNPQLLDSFPKFIERPIVNGTGVLVVPEKRFEPKRSLPTCGRDHFTGFLEGTWNLGQNSSHFQPYLCNLLEVKQTKEVLQQILSGLWITFLGDSNTRNLFRTICDLSGGVISKVEQDFVCLGKDYVITLRIYWFKLLPLGNITSCSLHQSIQKAFPKPLDPSQMPLPDREEPDYVFVSLGSHSPDLAGPFMAQKTLEEWQSVAPTWLKKKKVVMMMITSSAASKIPDIPELTGMYLIQNNLRVFSVNAGVERLFKDQAPILDFFSTTLPLSSIHLTSDAVHFLPFLYSAHLKMIFTLISGDGHGPKFS